MNEIGIDISGHFSKNGGTFLGKAAINVVVFVCDRAEQTCPIVWPGAFARLSWPLEDPAACQGSEEERLATFRRVRDQLKDRIIDWLKQQASAPPTPQ